MILQDNKKLGRLMVVQGISQHELAKRAGLKSHSYIGQLVRGTATRVKSDTGVAIAKVLGVGTDDLFLTELSTETAPTAQSRRRKAA